MAPKEVDMDETYTVVLSDGTRIEPLTMNGNNFIYQGQLDTSVFENNTDPVVIIHGDDQETHEHMTYVEPYWDDADETWFVLIDTPEEELRYAALHADIQYVAMMADVDTEV